MDGRWWVVPGPTGLTVDEARALFLLVGGSASRTASARSALRKLMRALPDTFRADAAAAADAVVTDRSGWGERDRPRPALVTQLQDAVVDRRRVTLTYEDRARTVSTRVVDPWGLVDKDGVWYIVAGTDRGRRTYRLDRVRHAEVTDEAATRPGGLELAREWEGVVEEVERRRSSVTATLLVPARHVDVLLAQFGRHAEQRELVADGRVRVRVSAHLALSIAEQLAGWGAAVEVLEPEAVRAELARLGAELVSRYGGR